MPFLYGGGGLPLVRTALLSTPSARSTPQRPGSIVILRGVAPKDPVPNVTLEPKAIGSTIVSS